MMFHTYFTANLLDNIVDSVNPLNLKIEFLDTFISKKGYPYKFHFVKYEDKYPNFKIPVDQIYKTRYEDTSIFISLKKNSELINLFLDIDDYFIDYKDELIKNKKYVPILRQDKFGYPYLKVKLFKTYPDKEYISRIYSKDFYSGEIKTDLIQSVDTYKEHIFTAKDLVVFPNKLWTTEAEYGVTLRLKYVYKE